MLFAVAGLVPSLWLFMFFAFISRMIIGVEYAVQETLFQRSLPDYIRGRISTLERGAELTMFGLSSWVSSVLVYGVSAQVLTIFSGLLRDRPDSVVYSRAAARRWPVARISAWDGCIVRGNRDRSVINAEARA